VAARYPIKGRGVPFQIAQRDPQRALESGNYTEVDAVALSDRSERLAGIVPLDRFAALVVGQLPFATELDAVG
jgi:hypothetical protein